MIEQMIPMLKARAFLASCLFVLVAGFFASGCNILGASDDGEVQLETDRNSYTVDSTTVVQVTATNNFDDTVYYICTGQIFLEELEEGEVVDSWLVRGFEKCGRRGPIEPNQSKTFEISFEWSLHPDRLESAQFDESVCYRLRMDLFETYAVDQLLDKRDRLSNNFRITHE
jgi:hypothetical protein